MLNYFDLSNCRLCPRDCGVNRLAGERGYCGEGAVIRASRAALMYYEEPCISGFCGSGAVFFCGCSLGCLFCQNYAISSRNKKEEPSFSSQSIEKGPVRMELTPEKLADVFLSLQEQKAANINLVTASHFLPLLIPSLESARRNGLVIPVVYNTSSYERPEALRRLEGLVDIYIPDLKFCDPALSAAYAGAPDYFERAAAAIREMVRQQPSPLFSDGSHTLDAEDDSDDPMMLRGVIIRHMVMPGHTEDSRKILRYLYEEYGDSVFLSIMNQYTPMPQVLDSPVGLRHPLLKRTVTEKEYDEVIDFAISLGITNGFIQEGGTVSRSFIPAFDGTGL
ncbi:MAG: radical SAM protein [Lachnospiraceae bacterium]|nr:radical SAM protein [Lachnospiraceae bacterium]